MFHYNKVLLEDRIFVIYVKIDKVTAMVHKNKSVDVFAALFSDAFCGRTGSDARGQGGSGVLAGPMGMTPTAARIWAQPNRGWGLGCPVAPGGMRSHQSDHPVRSNRGVSRSPRQTHSDRMVTKLLTKFFGGTASEDKVARL